MAFKEGVHKGGADLLEPIMKVEAVVPEEYLGDVIGQLNGRRGMIQGMELRPGNAQAVNAQVPVYQSATVGRVMPTAASGKQVLGARSANLATVASTVSTVVVSINRPHLQGQTT